MNSTPTDYSTEYWFEYTPKTGFGWEFKTPVGAAGPAAGRFEASVPVTGLLPGTGYYVQLVTKNELGTDDGLLGNSSRRNRRSRA